MPQGSVLRCPALHGVLSLPRADAVKPRCGHVASRLAQTDASAAVLTQAIRDGKAPHTLWTAVQLAAQSS
jgi:hypothetical protein